MKLMEKIFGSRSDREIKKLMPLVEQINQRESLYQAMTDEELRGMTPRLKDRLAAGETTDDILPDAFAVCREAARRVLGMRHYDVQLLGGIVLHQGRIAEMRTGEGKTLVATLPAYLNALTGKGVHIVTVNDYLARRDSEWMGKVYRFLGLEVGLIVHGLTNAERRKAYAADVTYGTNNELGFDYLRDNMAIYKQEMVGRGYAFAIVDEVDSILVDEARTPLIISGQGDQSTDLYQQADRFASGLRVEKFRELDTKEENDQIDADCVVDEKAKSVTLTAEGIAKAERFFDVENLADIENSTLSHHINQAIRAHTIMQRDVDYVVRDGQVIIVDEFTGRLMFGRRYSEGLHQAIEAKEKVKVERESKTLATITFQNFFRLYGKLSGMTGTALTEEAEFQEIYSLDVLVVPTNKPMIRMDSPDVVYKTEMGKFRAVIQRIKESHAVGQPVLVGTVSIEKSEILSAMLKREGVAHQVLNAKYHEKEAEVVAQAGQLGAVTIATNMAGRGTDIVLGGNAEYMARAQMKKEEIPEEIISEAVGFGETGSEEILAARARYRELYDAYKEKTSKAAEKVVEAGGLLILGTERHESRRIDNQLRGRAGRQGDPGGSVFYLSLEDDLMRLFGSERIMGMMETLGIDEDTPIDQKILSGAIESAQRRVESRNFQTRKHVLQYDDVMNKQREIIYGQRQEVLAGEDLSASIAAMRSEVVSRAVGAHRDEHGMIGDEDARAIAAEFTGVFLAPGEMSFEEGAQVSADELEEKLHTRAEQVYREKEERWGPLAREVERVILLKTVDSYWMDHIDAMDELRKGIGLRAYAQTDPVNEYRREGFDMFDQMTLAIREETVRTLYRVELKGQAEPKRQRVASEAELNAVGGENKKIPVKKGKKPGRNDPCPCGSGKKYKKCCGRNE